MNKFIEFIKRIFMKKPLALNEAKNPIEENCSNQKNAFLNNLIVENFEENDIPLLQIRLEEGMIKEEKLSDEQIIKLKQLYSKQIIELENSINDYKLKLRIS